MYAEVVLYIVSRKHVQVYVPMKFLRQSSLTLRLTKCKRKKKPLQ